MATADSETAGDAPSTELVDLVNALHRSGAISDLERAALVSAVEGDVARDIAVHVSRNQLIYPRQTADTAFKEAIMNPKSIIKSIERSRAVMEAQVEKLNEFAPTPPRVVLAAAETQANVSTLLNTTVRGHLQGAADALHAIAEIEAQVRMAGDDQDDSTKCRRQPQVIVAEAITVKSEGSK